MFLSVQARIATDDERARRPFLAIYIKYRFLRLSGKISASHEYSRTSHPLFPFTPHHRRSISLQPLAIVKSARLGLTNGTTKEKSLFSRLCPISRLHPSFPYASSPPLLCSALEVALSESRPLLLLNLLCALPPLRLPFLLLISSDLNPRPPASRDRSPFGIRGTGSCTERELTVSQLRSQSSILLRFPSSCYVVFPVFYPSIDSGVGRSWSEIQPKSLAARLRGDRVVSYTRRSFVCSSRRLE